MRLFQLAYSCGQGEQTYLLLLKKLRYRIKEHGHIDTQILDYICQYNPADVLGLIKLYGSLWSGDWQDNLCDNKARTAVNALNLLGRTQQAQLLAQRYGVQV